MWDDGAPDVVERDGQKWLRVRAFEKDVDTRACAKGPTDYEFHEGDGAYLARGSGQHLAADCLDRKGRVARHGYRPA